MWVTNAKRAIYAQIDEALLALGFESLRWDINRKLKVFTSLGFLSPRVLKKVAAARNILEHEYRSPTENQVEEALDLAALFIGATKLHLHTFEGEFSLGNASEQVDPGHCSRELTFGFDEDRRIFRVTAWTAVPPEHTGSYGTRVGSTEIAPAAPAFSAIVRLVIAGERPRKVREALEAFFDVVGIP